MGDGKGIVDERVPERSEYSREPSVLRFFAFPKTEILEEHDWPAERRSCLLGVSKERHGSPKQPHKMPCDGPNTLTMIRVMREEDDLIPSLTKSANRREVRPDAEVPCHAAVRHRHVEINAQEHAPLAERIPGKCLHHALISIPGGRTRGNSGAESELAAVKSGSPERCPPRGTTGACPVPAILETVATQMEILESGKRNIVILGAGFGGITALLHARRRLRRAGLSETYQIILVNSTWWQLYTPALYEIAAIPRGEANAIALKSAICIPIDAILRRLPGVKFIGETVAALDPERHTITFRNGDLVNFEYCIIALGVETNYFGIPGLAEYGFPLKTFEDAVQIRNRIEALMRGTTGPLRIVVAGGGATGVEFAAELVNYLCFLTDRQIAGKCQEEVILLEGGPEILSGFSPRVVRWAMRRLVALGIRIRANMRIKSVSAAALTLVSSEELACELLVWAGGVKPAAALEQFGLERDAKGRIAVNDHLEARPRIYAIGDCAGYINPATGKALPWNVPVAESQARVAARNIIADIRSQPKRVFRAMANYPFILAVGGKYALTDLVIIRLSGLLGWLAKQAVELRYLLSILGPKDAFTLWMRTLRVETLND